MKRLFTPALAAAALALSVPLAPLAAQEDSEPSAEEIEQELDAMGAMFGDMFGNAEPLTPEQEARVPLAQSVVLKVFPEGTYAKMMDETMKPMMDAVMANIAGSPGVLLMELTGLPPSALAEIDEAKLNEAVALLDPSAEARNAEMADTMLRVIGDIVVQIEPSYRAGLARAYAVRFTEDELAGLDAYFATPVGAKYAAESFLIYADPQVMASMNEMMPAVMEAMPAMMGDVGAIAEKYPKGRTFSDLSEEEQTRLAGLLDTTLENLAANEPEPVEDEASQVDEEQEWVEQEGAS
ncbi:MAG: hypothetical protein QNI87_13570 [Erythrobacter sp.]|uniref:hypothetical protein n=1 Tax=Erythrobacter sp. TaxID=1042 RepID=UPI002618A49C|nr:hypothetical protein [Erythrobacter sp.]MDJ0979551.1 hypothetical protein [Erythrobacter sp.]